MPPSTFAYGKAAWGVSAMPVPCLSTTPRGRNGKYDMPLTNDAAMKCHWITKNWYPQEDYINMNVSETRKLYLNQKEKKRCEGKPTNVRTRDNKPVRDIHEFSTVISELSASVASTAEYTKQTSREIKRMKKAADYNSDNEDLFSSADNDDVQTNRGNAALARGSIKKGGRKRG